MARTSEAGRSWITLFSNSLGHRARWLDLLNLNGQERLVPLGKRHPPRHLFVAPILKVAVVDSGGSLKRATHHSCGIEPVRLPIDGIVLLIHLSSRDSHHVLALELHCRLSPIRLINSVMPVRQASLHLIRHEFQ